MSEIEKFLNKFGSQSLIAPFKDRNKAEDEKPVSPKTLKPVSVEPTFGKMNSEGDFGLFFLVNESNHPVRRTLDNIVRVRAVYIEDDTTGKRREPSSFPIPPNIIVNTSPGKYHYYWLTSTTNIEESQRVQQTLVDEYGCDPNARDAARVLRIPGTYHKKGETPFLVTAEYIVDSPYMWDVILQAFPPAKRVVKTNHNESGKFDKNSAESKIVSSENFHETLRDLALSYANRNLDREDIADLLRAKMYKVPPDQRDERWENRIGDAHLYECVDSALRKVAAEQIEKEIETTFLPRVSSTNTIPPFPEHIFEQWPEPWPLIWEVFKNSSYEPVPALLVPTMLSTMSYLMGGKYVNQRGKRPQFMFLNLCESTGAKDTNSRNVIEHLSAKWGQEESGPRASTAISANPFAHMLAFPPNITADVSFVESFDEKGNMFWMNTEATRIYHQIKSSTQNSSVMALADKMIEAVDGKTITGKMKSGKIIGNIVNPNCHIIFYAQPETIEKYIDQSLIDSGLFGRCTVTIVPAKKFDKSTYDRFTPVQVLGNLPEGFDKVVTALGNVSINAKNPEMINLDDEQIKVAAEWFRTTEFIDLMAESDDFRKIMDRHAMQVEKLYTLVFGVVKAWHAMMGTECPARVDLGLILPLVEYWLACTTFAMRNLIQSTYDPLADELIEIIKGCIVGDLKLTGKDKAICMEHHAVPVAQITRIMKNRRKVLDKLNLSVRSVGDHIKSSLAAMENLGIVVKIEVGNKQCYAIAKDALD